MVKEEVEVERVEDVERVEEVVGLGQFPNKRYQAIVIYQCLLASSLYTSSQLS